MLQALTDAEKEKIQREIVQADMIWYQKRLEELDLVRLSIPCHGTITNCPGWLLTNSMMLTRSQAV